MPAPDHTGSPSLDQPLRSRHEAALAIARRALQRADNLCNGMPADIRSAKRLIAAGDIVREALDRIAAGVPEAM